MLRRVLVAALVAGAVSSWSLAATEAASAASASCATPPPAYTGTDATVAAVTQLNIDADQNCSALSDRLDSVHGDLGPTGPIGSQVAGADADVRKVDTDVNGVNSTLQGGIGTYSTTGPSGPTGPQTVELGPSSTAQLDGLGQSTHVDLWMLIGALVGAFTWSVVLRKVWP